MAKPLPRVKTTTTVNPTSNSLRTWAKTGLALGALLYFGHARGDTIFVTDAGDNTVQQLNGAGDPGPYIVSGLAEPMGLAFDAFGNLFVGNFANNTIEKVNASGGETLFASAGLSGPKGLAFDSSGNLYVANFWSSTIEKFNSSGHGTVFASAGLSNPYGLAFDPLNGDLYVGNNNGTIEKFNSSGHGSLFASGLGEAVGLAFDGNGDLFAADYDNCSIDEFSPSGHESLFACLGAGNHPIGVAFDSSGNLLVSTSAGTIDEINPNGCPTVFASDLSSPWFFAMEASAIPVPEPSSGLLLVLGTAACFGYGRVRRMRQ